MAGRSDEATQLEAAALALLERAFDVASADRAAFLARETDGDADLAERVAALLYADAAPDRGAITGGAADAFGRDVEDHPDRVGAYRIARLIGRGGMGAVYLGRRDAGDFEHEVAIKFVTGAAPGAARKRLSERLRTERRTLAKLKHPNIAQLYDGGETEGGVPYLIMEFVAGEPLDDWLAGAAPPARLRLDVFREACLAVAHAHQNLIVHRDLSPANILVTIDGHPKVIDFGISRTIGEAPDPTRPRRTATRGYTPPERADGDDATTLGDIFSLGRILMDMLAGMAGDSDLDAIALKASAEDPSERYASVAALVDDVDRARAGLPVAARGDGLGYVLGKFVRRRRLAVGAGVLGAALGAAALIVMTVLYAQAERARQEADARFDETRALARFMLFDLYDELAEISGNTRSLTGIAEKSGKYLDVLAASPRASGDLRLEIADGYRRLGEVLGSPIGQNLGQRKEAAEKLKRAYDLLARERSDQPDNPEAARLFAKAAFSMAVFEYIASDDNALGHSYAEEAAEALAPLATLVDATVEDRRAWIEARAQAAKPLMWDDRSAEAVERLKAARDDAAALAAGIDAAGAAPEHRRLLAVLNVALTEAMERHFDQVDGDYLSALPYVDEAIAIYTDIGEQGVEGDIRWRGLLTAHFRRAMLFYSVEDDERTISDLEAARKIADIFLAGDPEDEGIRRNKRVVEEMLAQAYSFVGRYGEATGLAESILDRQRAALAEAPDDPELQASLTQAKHTMGEVFFRAEAVDYGCRLFASAREDWRKREASGDVEAWHREHSIAELDELLKGVRHGQRGGSLMDELLNGAPPAETTGCLRPKCVKFEQYKPRGAVRRALRGATK